MKHFCTLSDKNYLAKGIAMYESLKRHCNEPFKLYYLALDDETNYRLLNLGYGEVESISLKDLEEQEKDLRTARANRPYNEYCWTLASYFIQYLLKQKLIDHICYIDSDIYFYQDPDIIYKEIDKKSVGIIAHRHNCIGNQDGAYNVGIIYFKNNDKGKEILNWWMDAVLHKKYPEFHGCGDQRYLEGFIPRFGEENTCVADKTFGHGAPWNYRLYVYDKLNEGKIIWGDKEQPFVFNHFSRFSYDLKTDVIHPTSGQYSDHTLYFQVFKIPEIAKLYQEYYIELKKIHQMILSSEPVLSQKTETIVEAPHIKKSLKIAIGMILFEGDYILKQCLESIYPFASQIMIAEGPVEYWQSQGRTTSTDKSNEIIEHFPDPEKKIEIIHGQFKEKDAQCKAYMPFLKEDADYIWNLDSDEILIPEDIEKIVQILYDNKYTSVGIRPLSFYGSFDRYITGWEEKKDQFLRIFKVYPGSTWITHRPPKIAHTQETILEPKHLDSDTLFQDYGIRMFHYSYVFPRQVYNKIIYYKNAVTKNKCIDDYFEKIYIPWITGDKIDREMIEQGFKGVHEWKPEYRTDTFTAQYDGLHPSLIRENMEGLMTEFNTQLESWQKNGKF